MNLYDLENLRSVDEIRFRSEKVEGQEFIIVSYMISNSELWKIDNALEARGITFDAESGSCVSRPFEKFFNLGENEKTQLNSENFKGATWFEKVDGSMVTPVLCNNGKIMLKTKKSFFSDVAVSANANMPSNVENLCEHLINMGMCPIFEYTDPAWRIVIDNGEEPEFTLLAIRNLVTGEYADNEFLINRADKFDVVTATRYFGMSYEAAINSLKTQTDFEGYVAVLKNGQRVKLKTEWYLANHHIMTALRERDVARLILDEQIDDIKERVIIEGYDITPIESLEVEISQEVSKLQAKVVAELSTTEGMTAKEVAIKYKGHSLFSLIMAEFNGKVVNYPQVWKKDNLQKYSLRAVYNTNFGGDHV